MHIRLPCLASFFLFLAYSAFAAEGVMSGEKDIRTVRTEWFDIIYAEDSRASADMLAHHADAIYREVCGTFGTEPRVRLPVVITPAVDEANAYYTPAFYDRIVIYDAPVTEKTATADNDFLSTFRHELTHAVSYNLKNKFWQTVDSIFGDLINPAGLFITSSHAEGAAVVSESMNGEGRLNDSYSAQMVRQAKIEGLFPGYADIYGAHDIYPYDPNYYFGSAFDWWLQKTYGMDKYAQFWYKCVNFQTVHQSVAFKSVFGISVRDAWKLFEDSVSVPSVPADPLKQAGYADYFTGTVVRSPENSRGSLYTSLSSGDGGFSFIDRYGKGFWYSAWDERSGAYEKPRKLFSVTNAVRAVSSSDGRYVAVSITSTGYAVPKNIVRIYGMRSRRWFCLKETGLRDAAVITSGGIHYLVAVKTLSQVSSLYVYRLTEDKDGSYIRKAELSSVVPFPSGDIPFCVTDGGSCSAAYVCKSGLAWSVCIYSLADGSTARYALPEDRMVVHDVSLARSGNGVRVFTFSWTKPGSMPRLGELAVGTGPDAQMKLQDDDVSGGIYEPVMLKTGLVAYSGEFFRDWRLMLADTDAVPFLTFVIRNSSDPLAPSFSAGNPAGQEEDLSAPDDVSFPYYKRGLLLPFSDTVSYTYDEDDGTVSGISLPYGALYITSDPWMGRIAAVSAGYSPYTDSAAVKGLLRGGTSTSLCTYTAAGQAEFDRHGYKQTYDTLQLSSSVPAGQVSSFSLTNTSALFQGRQSLSESPSGSMSFGCLEDDSLRQLFRVSDSLTAAYSNIHRVGPGTYQSGGISLAVSYKTLYTDDSGLYQNLSPAVTVRLPYLLPYICRQGYTYDFPLAAEAALFSSESVFLSHAENLVLFASEVQRAVPFVTLLYFCRYSFSAVYSGSFVYDDAGSWDIADTPELARQMASGGMDYYDAAGLKASASLSPNFGICAGTSFIFTLSAQAKYRLHKTSSQNRWVFTLSGSLSF